METNISAIIINPIIVLVILNFFWTFVFLFKSEFLVLSLNFLYILF